MALGGISGILLTAPLTSAEALDRLRRLLLRGADVSVTADHPGSVAPLSAIATATGRTVPVLVDIDMGMARTGCRTIDDVVDLARELAGAPGLKFSGIQAYWGNLQQVMPFSERARLIGEQLERTRTMISALHSAGHKPAIVSGGGTGSHRIDAASGLFTEMQPGSFLFMDSCYGGISISENDNPFAPSLFVSATVVSANHPGKVTVNAGWKAFAADSGKPVAVRGAPANSTYRFMGDEHGIVEFAGDRGPQLGANIEFLTSHCDPTVNLYNAFHVVRGEEVVDIWPIRARY